MDQNLWDKYIKPFTDAYGTYPKEWPKDQCHACIDKRGSHTHFCNKCLNKFDEYVEWRELG